MMNALNDNEKIRTIIYQKRSKNDPSLNFPQSEMPSQLSIGMQIQKYENQIVSYDKELKEIERENNRLRTELENYKN